MTRWMMMGVGVLVWVAGVGAPDARAADDRGEGTVIKSEDGLRFKLPADWPVEKRGNVVAPIPVEEYLAKKFSAMDTRLRQVEQQLASFDLRLRVMEENLKEQNRLRSGEASSP
jgi:hypothetical protein